MTPRFVALLLGAALTLLPPAVRGEENAPDAVVKNVTTEVLSILRDDKEIRLADWFRG